MGRTRCRSRPTRCRARGGSARLPGRWSERLVPARSAPGPTPTRARLDELLGRAHSPRLRPRATRGGLPVASAGGGMVGPARPECGGGAMEGCGAADGAFGGGAAHAPGTGSGMRRAPTVAAAAPRREGVVSHAEALPVTGSTWGERRGPTTVALRAEPQPRQSLPSPWKLGLQPVRLGHMRWTCVLRGAGQRLSCRLTWQVAVVVWLARPCSIPLAWRDSEAAQEAWSLGRGPTKGPWRAGSDATTCPYATHGQRHLSAATEDGTVTEAWPAAAAPAAASPAAAPLAAASLAATSLAAAPLAAASLAATSVAVASLAAA